MTAGKTGPVRWGILSTASIGTRLVIPAMQKSSTLTIAAIARASGFVDASHFSRRFRLALGCTPTAWRAEHHDHSPGMNADAPRRAE
jgi:AraC-like DNA-binding protein